MRYSAFSAAGIFPGINVSPTTDYIAVHKKDYYEMGLPRTNISTAALPNPLNHKEDMQIVCITGTPGTANNSALTKFCTFVFTFNNTHSPALPIPLRY